VGSIGGKELKFSTYLEFQGVTLCVAALWVKRNTALRAYKSSFTLDIFPHAHSTTSCWCFFTDLLNQHHMYVLQSTPHVCVAIKNTCMCCNQEHINVFPLFSLIVCLCHYYSSMFMRRLSWRESGSTFCFLWKVTFSSFKSLASSVMSLGKPQFILVVPHTLLLLDNSGTHYASESVSFASSSSITASKSPSSWIFLF
jgi:hypothetical protein